MFPGFLGLVFFVFVCCFFFLERSSLLLCPNNKITFSGKKIFSEHLEKEKMILPAVEHVTGHNFSVKVERKIRKLKE